MWEWLQSQLGEAPTHVRDDRGAVHAIRADGYAGVELAKPFGAGASTHASRAYLRLRRQAASPLYHLVLGSSLVSLALAAFYAGKLAFARGDITFAALAYGGGGVCILIAVRNPVWMRRRAALMHHQLLGPGSRCLVCAYDISSGQPDADGCTICPECGAAWRIPTPTR